jgi:hypothetical protein
LTHFGAVSKQARSRRCGSFAVEPDSKKGAVDMAAIAGHDDWFLAEKATLGVADGLLRAANFHDQAILIDVLAVNRRSGFDAQHFPGIKSSRFSSAG